MLRIGIEKPCGENWAAFPKQRDGFVLKGHCASCNKHVIDFTTWGDERIRDYFSSKPVDVCGRLRSSQLKDYQLQKKQRKSFQYFYGLLLTALLSFTSKLTEAQVRDKPSYITALKNDKLRTNQPAKVKIFIEGKVISVEDSLELPGVNVVQKKTTNGTVTDIDGSFRLAIDNPSDSVTLVFSFIGLKPVEATISTRSVHTRIDIAMKLDIQQLTEVVWTGGLYAHTISPRRWWWNLKGLFRGGRY